MDGVNVEPIEKRWSKYFQYYSKNRSDEFYSPIWSQLSKDFAYKSGTSPESLRRKIESGARGYSFVKSLGIKSSFHFWCQYVVGGVESASEKVGSLFSVVARKFITFFVKALSSKSSGRDYSVYDARIFKMLKVYRNLGIDKSDFAKVLGSGYPIKLNYNSLKNYFFYRVLTDRIPIEQMGNKVLEVGAGAANLAILLSKANRNKMLYTIIDLPEMILVSSNQISHYLPDADLILPNEFDESVFKRDLKRPTFVFLMPDQVGQIPNDYFDLAINIESFAEMKPATAHDYLKTFYRSLKDGGRVFVCNRESRLVNAKGDKDKVDVNCFWNYPFSDQDEIVLQQYCPMRAIVKPHEPNLNRISTVRKK